MSLERIESVLEGFPLPFRDPILGYANSVKNALPDILREARLQRDPILEDEIVFIAGIRKLHAIVSSTFWTLRKALVYLGERDIVAVRIAGRDYSFQSREYGQLRDLYDSLQELLDEDNLTRFVKELDYVEVARTLANERQQG